MTKEFLICCLCSRKIKDFGNNPYPLMEDGRCCDKCNSTKVIPARINIVQRVNLKYGRENLRSNIKLALLGADCTSRYAETATNVILNNIIQLDKEFIKRLKEALDTYFHEGDCKLCKREDIMVNMNSDCISCILDKLSGSDL